jgi:class 3 adenylate cyclase
MPHVSEQKDGLAVGKEDRPEMRKRPVRIPIRLRWMMLSGLAVSLAVLLLALIILDFERDAWLDSQSAQAEILVDRLADELKIPALAFSTAEVDKIVTSFLKKIPAVLGVYFLYASGEERHYGVTGLEKGEISRFRRAAVEEVRRLPSKDLWFIKKIVFSDTHVGTVAVRFSEKAWTDLATRLVQRMLLAALFVLVLFSLVVYWIAGRMSRPLESLARAARYVARGDFSIQLPVEGNDEITDAVSQFNDMVKELAHKKEIREIFSRYLNPKLVEGVFGGSNFEAESKRQAVTILFADMVQFTEFSAVTPTEEVIKILNQHFEVFHRIIDYFDGHVDKYIGDALMAVFNHPNMDPEHVKHATMAGLAMARACARLGLTRHTGEPIEFRIGINSGEAIVGNMGAAERLEYTVIGDAVNVASRMAGVGAGGEVVLSRTTFSKLGKGFAFHSLGRQQIRGIAQLIECGKVRCVDKRELKAIDQAVNLAFELGYSSKTISLVKS